MVGRREESVDRRDERHRAPCALSDHLLGARLHQQERLAEIAAIDHFVVVGELEDGAPAGLADDVDEHVDAAERVHHCGECFVDPGAARDVGDDRDRLAATGPDLFGDCLGPALVEVEAGDPRPRLGQRQRRRAAHPGSRWPVTRAGHDRPSAVQAQFEHVSPPIRGSFTIGRSSDRSSRQQNSTAASQGPVKRGVIASSSPVGRAHSSRAAGKLGFLRCSVPIRVESSDVPGPIGGDPCTATPVLARRACSCCSSRRRSQ